MLHRNYGMDYVRSLPLKTITKFLEKAVDLKDREEAFDIWLVLYQNMTKDTFISFDDFYAKHKGSNDEEETDRIDLKETFKEYKRMVLNSGNQV